MAGNNKATNPSEEMHADWVQEILHGNVREENKKRLEDTEKKWQEHRKKNPPKYEGRIFVGGNEKGYYVMHAISPEMYPAILINLRNANPMAFALALMNLEECVSIQLDMEESQEDDASE